jgi:uncharacterized protein YjbI with pentapeptide repeats
LAQIIGGFFVLAGLYSSLQTFNLQREGQITDRFTKAIDQLGAVETGADGKSRINLEVRVGGIYALERIARDSPTDHWTIMEVLSTYVRENSPATNNAGKAAVEQPPQRTPIPHANVTEQHLRADLQAVLTVIGRRNITHDPPNGHVDLSKADLTGADLTGADLTGITFPNADLSAAELGGAQLNAANLRGADLTGADLTEADLSEADLSGAHFNNASLSNAHLNRAYLNGTDFSRADLSGADLSGGVDPRGMVLSIEYVNGADFSGVDLTGVSGLNQSQLDKVKGNMDTKLPEGRTRPKWWSLPDSEQPLLPP